MSRDLCEPLRFKRNLHISISDFANMLEPRRKNIAKIQTNKPYNSLRRVRFLIRRRGYMWWDLDYARRKSCGALSVRPRIVIRIHLLLGQTIILQWNTYIIVRGREQTNIYMSGSPYTNNNHHASSRELLRLGAMCTKRQTYRAQL